MSNASTLPSAPDSRRPLFPKLTQQRRQTSSTHRGVASQALLRCYFLKGTRRLSSSKKEDQFGAKPLRKSTKVQIFGTRCGVTRRGDAGDQLAKEIGIDMPRISMPISLMDNCKYPQTSANRNQTIFPYQKE